MNNTLESRTGEYVTRLRGRGRPREWIVELEFFAGDKAILHTETNRVRAEGVYYFLLDYTLLACKLAEELIGQKNFTEGSEE